MMAQKQNNLPLIPLPEKLIIGNGNFEINESTVLFSHDENALKDLNFLQSYIVDRYNITLKATIGSSQKRSVFVKRNSSMKPDEYTLYVDSMNIKIEGGTGAGVFYGIQTLIQLLPAGRTTKLSVAAVEISDQPRFSWRGMHLDVCRHFFTVKEVKKYLDYLAMYKMNVFHWHLTDDQGWRIEIKKYPKLTEIGGYRNGTLIGHYSETPERYDTIRYGGFYTQDEIKDVIEYAGTRHIQIVPEIEMPGHALAALAAYPMLACTPGPFEVGKSWGVFKDVFCPSELTFNFLQDVLTEVSELFPGKYIHIGGDECPKDRWKESSFCQELMKKEGLKDEHELQSYFVQRMGKFLQTKNKKLIGWDEILEGGIAEDATIMSWRGYAGGVTAAKQKHDVVMTPTAYCYFDYYQSASPNEPLAIGGYLPLNMVYRFEPVADVLTADESKYILGTQGNIWTEYIDTWKKLEYMAMPRMAALAEVAWTKKELKDYDGFARRLSSHTKLLSFLNVNYSKAFYDISTRVTPNGSRGINVELLCNYPNGQIHYTTNMSEPNATSPVYTSKFNFDQSMMLKAALFEGRQMKGNVFSQKYLVNYATGKEVTLKDQPDPEYSKGGAFTLVNGIVGNLPWNGNDWLGFQKTGIDATIDLEIVREITQVNVDVLNDSVSWIYPPASIEVLVSEDNIEFASVGKLNSDEIKKSGRLTSIKFAKRSARYVKVVATTKGKIEAGAPGAGNDAWIMVDEIQVN
ncbi:MAG: family 20 glycosylhydrolase [Bacteroidetes bacterium]|nr:family 20 glycosylhydrolase [Bacteroidota bacterium]